MKLFQPKEVAVSKRFPKLLMERAGLLRYASGTGQTTLVIQYDADSGEGRMDVIWDAPTQKDRAEKDTRT